MKGKRGFSKQVPCSIYKKVGIVLFVAFMIYISIKTIKTQQRKKMEGFKVKKRGQQNNNDDNNNKTIIMIIITVIIIV